MSDGLMRVYRVFDTDTETFYFTPNGKSIWASVGAAKNAVNANPPKSMWGKNSWSHKKFSEQDRLEVRAFILVEDK